MLSDEVGRAFDTIYASDLVFVKDCFKLCGDAFCCNFARYKTKFKVIAQTPFQELPLLPGEYEYLESKGWREQFGDFNHKVVEYAIDHGAIRVESIVSRRQGCACDHDTRPTICRLYPLLPVFDLDARLVGIDSIGIYEVLEELEELPHACQLNALPFDEMQKYLTICDAIASIPMAHYYITAYRLTKAHVAARLAEAMRETGKSVFSLFEMRLLRNRLIDHSLLRADLDALAARFEERYGPRFRLA